MVFVAAVAFAADDGSYRPEHHGGSYANGAYNGLINGAYNPLNYGRYYNDYYRNTLPYRQVVQPIPVAVRGLPVPVPVQQFAQPIIQPVVQPQLVRYQPNYRYQPSVRYQSATAEGNSQTLRDVREQSPTGDYAYEYETQNGIVAREQSQFLPPNVQRKTGFYQYPSTDGQVYRVDWVADENGFHPSGAHLPTAPAIPEEIARSIQTNLKIAKQQ